MTAYRWKALMIAWEEKERRADRRAALIACTTFNMLRDASKVPALQVEDFMPGVVKMDTIPESEQTPDQLLARIRFMNQAFGGKEV